MSLAWSALELGLSTLGVLDRRLPRSYADGALPPAHLAVVPQAAAPSAPAPLEVDATPDDQEPGLVEELFGASLSVDAVEAVLDELVRPALNADGGDITLVKIDGNDVYVRLVGACNTCPSSVMTMKMGVERLLQEEFPEMGELIQVTDDLM